jgi:hypothetical protein
VKVPSALQTAGGLPITHISVANAREVLALNTAAADNVYTLNSTGNAWTAQTEWLSNAEIGADGTIVGTGSDGNTWAEIGGAWSKLAAGSPAIFAVAGANMIWAVSTSGVIETWNGTGWTALSPAPPFTPSQAIDALGIVGDQTLSVLDTSGGIHIFNPATGLWSTISGTATAITGGGVYLFTRDGGAAYHVNLTVPALTNTVSQTHPCFILKESGGGTHLTCGSESLTATAYFGGAGGAHGTGGVSTTDDGTEPATLTASATEQGATCDPFYAASSANCTAFYDDEGTYLCEISGPDGGYEEGDCDSDSGPTGVVSAKYGVATTGAQWLGAGQDGQIPGGAVYCNAGQYCTAGTTPPLCAVKSPVYVNTFGQTGTPDQVCALHAAWTEEIPYGSFTFATGTVLTFCSPVQDIAIPVGPTAPAVNCTTQP